MYEKSHEKLLPKRDFLIRLGRNIGFGIISIFFALGLGMLGYHQFEKMTWVDSFANASMILSGMGPLTPLQTEAGKIFAGFYALFSGLAFILIMGLIFAPVLHRFFHKFHFDDNE